MRGKSELPTKKLDKNFVPTNYEDLYLHYIVDDQRGQSLCSQLLRWMMPYATPDERETLRHDVFLRMQEKDIIGIYDPSKANFGGTVYFVTRTVVAHHLDKKSRNPITGLKAGSLTENDPHEDGFEPGCYHLDKIFETAAPNYENEIDAKRLVGKLFDWARNLHEQNQHRAADPKYKRDASMLPLLEMMIEEREPKECAEVLGVSTSTVSNWIIHLKQQLTDLKREAGLLPAEHKEGHLDKLFSDETPEQKEELLNRLYDWAQVLYHENKDRADNNRHKRDASLLQLLFSLEKDVDPKATAHDLGISTSTVMNWVQFLRMKVLELKAKPV